MTTILAREQFLTLWRAECREFLQLLNEARAETYNEECPRDLHGSCMCSCGHEERALELQRERSGPLLLDRIRSGSLVLEEDLARELAAGDVQGAEQ
jgi:hypothetical protein